MMRCLTVVGVSGLETSIRLKMNGLGRNFMFIRKDTCKQVWQGDTIQPTATTFLEYTYIYMQFPQLECRLHKSGEGPCLIYHYLHNV